MPHGLITTTKRNRSMKKACLLSLLCLSTSLFAEKTPSRGVLLYEQACQLCHSPERSTSIKSPAAFNDKAWAKRFSAAKKEVGPGKRFKTVNQYLLHQIRIGRGLMHHGGLCKETNAIYQNVDCSDKAYLEAIEYMSHKKNKPTYD